MIIHLQIILPIEKAYVHFCQQDAYIPVTLGPEFQRTYAEKSCLENNRDIRQVKALKNDFQKKMDISFFYWGVR